MEQSTRNEANVIPGDDSALVIFSCSYYRILIIKASDYFYFLNVYLLIDLNLL